jgi:hypothetical protein
MFGDWIADIERPATQYRGRYQLRLADARALIAQTCPSLQRGDLTPPKYSTHVTKRQHPLRSKVIAASVLCPVEACNVSTTAAITLSTRRGSIKVKTDTVMLGPARQKTIKIDLSRRVRTAILNSIAAGGRVHARLRLRIADANGVATIKIVKLRLLK